MTGRPRVPTPTSVAVPESPRGLEETGYAIVVPSIGRPSLRVLLDSLVEATSAGQAPEEVVVVDDRPLARSAAEPLLLDGLPWTTRVLRSGGRGPAAARNAGWRSAAAPWIAFLDDDVEVPPEWGWELADDLAAAGPRVGGVQGRLRVPLPAHRRPTDWERGTAGLAEAAWATADMAYRRAALQEVHGFDERFPRAYREDADLALRVREAGWELTRGWRTTIHPVRPAGDAVSLRVQAGNADDALMRALHGPRWRHRAQTGRGRLGRHVATVLAAGAGVVGLLAGRPRVAAAGALAWAGLYGEFLARRLAPGPRPGEPQWAQEWRRMALTSVAIPMAAVWHRVRGAVRRAADPPAPWPVPLRAVLFDRDGTLVHDEPYNGDPDKVRPVEGAREALEVLRSRGVRVGVVTNQSGIGRGLLTEQQVAAVHRRVEELLGPIDTWQMCPHAPEAGCACRKPGAAMVLAAARELGVEPFECAVVGDIGADIGAALAAGAHAVLVPTGQTLPEEVASAPLVVEDLRSAVASLPGGPR